MSAFRIFLIGAALALGLAAQAPAYPTVSYFRAYTDEPLAPAEEHRDGGEAAHPAEPEPKAAPARQGGGKPAGLEAPAAGKGKKRAARHEARPAEPRFAAAAAAESGPSFFARARAALREARQRLRGLFSRSQPAAPEAPKAAPATARARPKAAQPAPKRAAQARPPAPESAAQPKPSLWSRLTRPLRRLFAGGSHCLDGRAYQLAQANSSLIPGGTIEFSDGKMRLLGIAQSDYRCGERGEILQKAARGEVLWRLEGDTLRLGSEPAGAQGGLSSRLFVFQRIR